MSDQSVLETIAVCFCLINVFAAGSEAVANVERKANSNN